MKRPQFLNEELTDILSNDKKEIVSLKELIESNEKNKNKDGTSGKKNDNENSNINSGSKNTNSINTNIKIPKMNPLSGMSKNFNKFDVVPGNAMTGLMMPFHPSSYIQESNKEE